MASSHTRVSLNGQFHLNFFFPYQTKCVLVLKKKTRCVSIINSLYMLTYRSHFCWSPCSSPECLCWFCQGRTAIAELFSWWWHWTLFNSQAAENWRTTLLGILLQFATWISGCWEGLTKSPLGCTWVLWSKGRAAKWAKALCLLITGATVMQTKNPTFY